MKAVVQYNIDMSLYDDFEKRSSINPMKKYIYEYSILSFAKYSKKFNIDHVLVTEPRIKFEHPTWERIDLWTNPIWFEKYDEILYVDTDVYALPWAPNIFSYSSDLSSFKKPPYQKILDNKKTQSDIPNTGLYKGISVERIRDAGLQAGVFILTKKSRDATLEKIKQYKDPKIKNDSQLINWSVITSNVPIFNLPKQFNVKYQGTINKDMYFLHAFGRFKDLENCPLKEQLREIYGNL